jgi:hypothetical protein
VVVLFAALALFSALTRNSNTVLAAQLTMDHAKCFRLFAGDGASSAAAARLESMLREFGWKGGVPLPSAAEGIQLIGARRCLYADGVIPHVMYRVDGRDVSLYMLSGVNRDGADVTSIGHRSHIWSSGGTTYVLVWPAEGGDMAKAVRYVMQAVG